MFILILDIDVQDGEVRSICARGGRGGKEAMERFDVRLFPIRLAFFEIGDVLFLYFYYFLECGT